MAAECEHGEPLGPAFACPPCQQPPAAAPPPAGDWSPPFDARFPGRCLTCDGHINPGDRIRFHDSDAIHDDCTGAAT